MHQWVHIKGHVIHQNDRRVKPYQDENKNKILKKSVTVATRKQSISDDFSYFLGFFGPHISMRTYKSTCNTPK